VRCIFSAAFGQRLDSGLPHAAQNFLRVVLSVPNFVQRIATTFPQAGRPSIAGWKGEFIDTNLDGGAKAPRKPIALD